MREADETRLSIEADARAVIRQLSLRLTERGEELEQERAEQKVLRRELLETQQLLSEKMVTTGLELVPPAPPRQPMLTVVPSEVSVGTSNPAPGGNRPRLSVSCVEPSKSIPIHSPTDEDNAAGVRALQCSQVADQLLAELEDQEVPVAQPSGPLQPQIPISAPLDVDCEVIAIGEGQRLRIKARRADLNKGSGWFRGQAQGAIEVHGLQPQCVELAIRFLESEELQIQDTLQCGGLLLVAEQLK